MVVLVVGAVAEVEGPLVVDLDEDDGPLGVPEAGEDLAERLEPLGCLVVERVARVARHGEGERRHRQHHRVAVRRQRLALPVPHDALGDAEERQLGVDVRPGAEDHREATGRCHLEEARDVEARVRLAEVEAARLDLVRRPRDVDVHEVQSERPERVEARPPVGGRVPPVVHRARVEREELPVPQVEPSRVEADARPLEHLRGGRNRRHALEDLGEDAVQERLEVGEVPVVGGHANERGLHLAERRVDVGEERRVPLHPLDEDEAPGVLQLPLHRHEVELEPQRVPVGGAEARGVARSRASRSSDELCVERLVAVVEQRDQVVDARAEERVLEVDPGRARPPACTMRFRDW